jgi:hypothetical protein
MLAMSALARLFGPVWMRLAPDDSPQQRPGTKSHGRGCILGSGLARLRCAARLADDETLAVMPVHPLS